MTHDDDRRRSPQEEKLEDRPDPMMMRALAPPFHRLRQVRQRKGIPEELVARRLHVDVATVKRQERESTDIRLGLLYRWKEVLDVPVLELLVDHDEPPSEATAMRELFENTLKTALRISRRSRQPLITRMALNMINQVLEIMPALKELDTRRGHPCPVDEFGHLVDDAKTTRPPLEDDE